MEILGVHLVDKDQYLIAFKGNKWVAIDYAKNEVDYENIARNKTLAYFRKAAEAVEATL
jgi:hypothetical protein